MVRLGDRLWEIMKRAYFLIGVLAGLILLWVFLDPRTSSRLPSATHQVIGVLWLMVATGGLLWLAFGKGNIFAEMRNKTIPDRKRITFGIIILLFGLCNILLIFLPHPKGAPPPGLYIAAIFFSLGGLIILFKKRER